jgi:hypothetical protein
MRVTTCQKSHYVVIFCKSPHSHISLLEKHARAIAAISHQFNRSTHRTTNEPHFSSVNQSMPTHQQITAAREQGSVADATTTIRVGQPTGAAGSTASPASTEIPDKTSTTLSSPQRC